MTTPIYHLAEPRVWATSGEDYRPSSLEEEGFIHCSSRDQVSRTARELYGERNDLVLLVIDPDQLGDSIVYEDLYEMDEVFPHIYGPLPATAVMETGPFLAHLEEGLWQSETRLDVNWMNRILHPAFYGVDISGHEYTRDEALHGYPADVQIELPLDGFHQDLVDEDVSLIRYVGRGVSAGEPFTAERSSLWINTNDGWRLRYHQGTPVGATGP